jgi:hypothetical protein
MGGSSQQPVTQQTTQTKDPWAAAQPHLIEAMENARGLFQSSGGYQPYTGNTVAPFDPYQTQGINAGAAIAQSTLNGTPGINAARDLGLQQIQNQGMNTGLNTAASQFGSIYNDASSANNPYLEDAINAQMAKANSAMSGAGRYGSGAHSAAVAQSVAPILAQDYTQRQQMRMGATGALTDLYNTGLNRAGQWSQNMPALDAARYADADRLVGYGEYNRQLQQSQLDAAAKLYNAQQAYPWEQVARYNAIIGGAGGLGGSSVTTAPGATQPSTLQKILGGGIAGAGLGGSFGGPAGAGIGAAGGGLLGLLG